MDCAKINKISEATCYLPTKTIAQLVLEQKYVVNGFKTAVTKYGTKIFVVLDEKYTISLPKRVSEAFMEDAEEFKKYKDAAKSQRLSIKFHEGEWHPCTFTFA